MVVDVAPSSKMSTSGSAAALRAEAPLLHRFAQGMSTSYDEKGPPFAARKDAIRVNGRSIAAHKLSSIVPEILGGDCLETMTQELSYVAHTLILPRSVFELSALTDAEVEMLDALMTIYLLCDVHMESVGELRSYFSERALQPTERTYDKFEPFIRLPVELRSLIMSYACDHASARKDAARPTENNVANMPLAIHLTRELGLAKRSHYQCPRLQNHLLYQLPERANDFTPTGTRVIESKSNKLLKYPESKIRAQYATRPTRMPGILQVSRAMRYEALEAFAKANDFCFIEGADDMLRFLTRTFTPHHLKFIRRIAYTEVETTTNMQALEDAARLLRGASHLTALHVDLITMDWHAHPIMPKKVDFGQHLQHVATQSENSSDSHSFGGNAGQIASNVDQ